MEFRNLGLSDLRVSAIVLGCMGMSPAYGAPADKKEMTELIADAVDRDILSLIRQKYTVLSKIHTTTKNFWGMLLKSFAIVW